MAGPELCRREAGCWHGKQGAGLRLQSPRRRAALSTLPAVPTGRGKAAGAPRPPGKPGLASEGWAPKRRWARQPQGPLGPLPAPGAGSEPCPDTHPVGTWQSRRAVPPPPGSTSSMLSPTWNRTPERKSPVRAASRWPRGSFRAALALALLPAGLWFLTLPEPRWPGPRMHGARPWSGLQARVPRGCFWSLLGLRAPPGAGPSLS